MKELQDEKDGLRTARQVSGAEKSDIGSLRPLADRLNPASQGAPPDRPEITDEADVGASARDRTVSPSWFFSGKPSEEMIDVYRKLTDAYPDSADCFCDLGCAYLEIGRYFWARDAFQKALEIAPDDRRALCNLAIAQHKLLDDAAAAETLEHFMELYTFDAAIALWRTCKRKLRIQAEEDQALFTQNPSAALQRKGLPQSVDISEAIRILREDGEDVDGMNDCEILLLYEYRHQPRVPTN